MKSWRPRLRAELEVEAREPTEEEAREAPGERGLLRHPDSAAEANLGPRAWRVARLLDGTRTLAEVAHEAGLHADTVENVTRQLLLLNLVEGAGDPILARLGQVRRREVRLDRMILDGARFQCQGSGECCQNYHFGPLKGADVARLEALPIAEELPHLGPGPYWEMRDNGKGQSYAYLKNAPGGDRCLFLEDDHRCAIHRRWGAEAKPDLCNTYPITEVATFDGLRTFDKGSCARMAESARRGPSLLVEMPKLVGLMYGAEEVFHPVVKLPGGLMLDFGHYVPIARSFMHLARAGQAGAARTLRGIGRALETATDELRATTLGPGEPDATVARLAARELSTFVDEAPDAARVEEGRRVAARLAGELVDKTTQRLGLRRPSEDGLGERLVRELLEVTIALRGLLSEPRDPYFDALAALPVDWPEADEVLRLSIRQQLFGENVVLHTSAEAALLRIAFIQLCALAGARLRAAAEGAPRVEATHLSRGHMLAIRVFPLLHSAELWCTHEPDTAALLAALPHLPTHSG